MRFKKSPQLPGAGRTWAGHQCKLSQKNWPSVFLRKSRPNSYFVSLYTNKIPNFVLVGNDSRAIIGQECTFSAETNSKVNQSE